MKRCRMAGLCIFSLLGVLSAVSGHGNMFLPPVWWDRGGDAPHIGQGTLDLPDSEYSDLHDGHGPDSMNNWYTNNVQIPGPPTIPDDLAQEDGTCAGNGDHNRAHPWNAPGTAPTYGPCGTLGGMPHGCNGDGAGNFGDCCSHRGKCGAFALGKNAEEYDWPGEIPVTQWLAGSQQEVGWYVGPNHAGGYSYRMCRMPEGGVRNLTEECFREMPLDFVGHKQWVIYKKDLDEGKRTEIHAKRTTEGTFPEGSMWTANPIRPKHIEGVGDDYGHGKIFDLVKVPNGLEPGEYVLSFRWDAKCSTQVWNACSNILII